MVWVGQEACDDGNANAQDACTAVCEVAICGDPAKVIDHLQELEETVPLEYLMVAPLSHNSFVTFTEKVMPKFI